jgi:hypothetical protein
MRESKSTREASGKFDTSRKHDPARPNRINPQRTIQGSYKLTPDGVGSRLVSRDALWNMGGVNMF